MPASTRQRTVRQPARSSNLKAKACRQLTNGMRPLTDKQVMLCNATKDRLQKRLGFVSADFIKSGSSQPLQYPRASRSEQASYMQEVGGPISAAAESFGTCVSTATAHKRNTTTVRKAGHRGPHGSSSRHRGVTQHKSVFACLAVQWFAIHTNL